MRFLFYHNSFCFAYWLVCDFHICISSLISPAPYTVLFFTSSIGKFEVTAKIGGLHDYLLPVKSSNSVFLFRYKGNFSSSCVYHCNIGVLNSQGEYHRIVTPNSIPLLIAQINRKTLCSPHISERFKYSSQQLSSSTFKLISLTVCLFITSPRKSLFL